MTVSVCGENVTNIDHYLTTCKSTLKFRDELSKFTRNILVNKPEIVKESQQLKTLETMIKCVNESIPHNHT